MRCALLLACLTACATTEDGPDVSAPILQGCAYGAAQVAGTALLQESRPVVDGGAR